MNSPRGIQVPFPSQTLSATLNHLFHCSFITALCPNQHTLKSLYLSVLAVSLVPKAVSLLQGQSSYDSFLPCQEKWPTFQKNIELWMSSGTARPDIWEEIDPWLCPVTEGKVEHFDRPSPGDAEGQHIISSPCSSLLLHCKSHLLFQITGTKK